MEPINHLEKKKKLKIFFFLSASLQEKNAKRDGQKENIWPLDSDFVKR